MHSLSAPEGILSHGSIRVTWHRATAIIDIVIGYPAPKPPKIYPTGTAGWFRRTSQYRGTFLPECPDGMSVNMPSHDLEISPDFEEVTYQLSPLYFDGNGEV